MKRVTMTQNVKNVPTESNILGIFRRALAEGEGDTGGGEGSAPTPQASAPVAMSEAELLKSPIVTNLMQNARTEEKNKLHQQIENLKSQIATEKANATTLATQLGEKTNEITRLNGDIERLKLEATASTDDVVKALKTDLATKDAQINALTGDVQALQVKYSSLELSTYRQAKIAEAGGQLIEELVSVSTMEEIDNSIVLAKNTYAKYAPQGGNSNLPANGGGQATAGGAQPQVTNPAPNQPVGGIELSQLNVMTSKRDRKLYMEAQQNLGR
jgi:hypothetical protein